MQFVPPSVSFFSHAGSPLSFYSGVFSLCNLLQHPNNLSKYTASLLSCPRTPQLYRIERLRPPRASVLRDAVQGARNLNRKRQTMKHGAKWLTPAAACSNPCVDELSPCLSTITWFYERSSPKNPLKTFCVGQIRSQNSWKKEWSAIQGGRKVAVSLSERIQN